MGIGQKILLAGALALFCWAPFVATQAAAAEEGLLVAQMQGQGGMQRQQGMPQGQPGGQQGMPQGQPGGMQPAQPGGQGGNNSCTQSYQRCVMMCAGQGTCVNNCNIGYAMCTQQGGQGGQRGGS